MEKLLKKYNNDIYKIPKNVANWTDAHGNSHPLWSTPFFKKEFKSFDQLTQKKDSSNLEIYSYFKVQALCLQNCYQNFYKGQSNMNKDKIKTYSHCKVNCYKEQEKTLEAVNKKAQ